MEKLEGSCFKCGLTHPALRWVFFLAIDTRCNRFSSIEFVHDES
jgi:hypothetical protein